MATPKEVQNYLAYWFQLGKPIHLQHGLAPQLPVPVLAGDGFSRAFHDCWQTIMANGGRDCHLEGTEETIEQLLSPQWEITDCARCSIPIAMPMVIRVAQLCPCSDIDNWPNDELPTPHLPINNKNHFSRLKTRLNQDPIEGYQLDPEADGHPAIATNDQHWTERSD
ncbi:hypothetical protein [Leptothoe sp. PORK10 BA2]|uniref:hypothetical protein n=1 Tax=Leptothoe sp. PORK10 BA2 TaxID=3110254 RepID=UPI002B21168D|nr:hypothetical protein [Leptothoe sp. PORK10 BA2]MEA5465108.1 hypothetical protein [Leptothoe sp. PORK10 BA2]